MVQFTRIWHYAQLREALQPQGKLGELSWSQARPVEPGGNIGFGHKDQQTVGALRVDQAVTRLTVYRLPQVTRRASLIPFEKHSS